MKKNSSSFPKPYHSLSMLHGWNLIGEPEDVANNKHQDYIIHYCVASPPGPTPIKHIIQLIIWLPNCSVAFPLSLLFLLKSINYIIYIQNIQEINVL